MLSNGSEPILKSVDFNRDAGSAGGGATFTTNPILTIDNDSTGATGNICTMVMLVRTGSATGSAWELRNVAGSGSYDSTFSIAQQTGATTMREDFTINNNGDVHIETGDLSTIGDIHINHSTTTMEVRRVTEFTNATSTTGFNIFQFVKGSTSGSGNRGSFTGMVRVTFSGATGGGSIGIYGFDIPFTLGAGSANNVALDSGTVIKTSAATGCTCDATIALSFASATTGNLELTLTGSFSATNNDCAVELIGVARGSTADELFAISTS